MNNINIGFVDKRDSCSSLPFICLSNFFLTVLKSIYCLTNNIYKQTLEISFKTSKLYCIHLLTCISILHIKITHLFLFLKSVPKFDKEKKPPTNADHSENDLDFYWQRVFQ